MGFGDDQFDMTPFGGGGSASYLSAEGKLRLLAQQDSILQPLFFTDGQIRWFDGKLQPGYLKFGKTCCVVTRVGTVRRYAHGTSQAMGLCRQEQPKFQFDVLDYDSERARSAAAALVNWFGRIDLSSYDQFGSPVTSPTRHPNQVTNQKGGLYYRIEPPPFWQMIEARIFNIEE